MKKTLVVLATMALGLLVAGGPLAAQEQAQGPRLQFGPYLGVTSIIISADEFDAAMQDIFPSAGSHYFPVFTQMGIGFQQFVSLGESRSSLAFHEIFLVAGLDQNMPIPNLNLVIAYHTRTGFEVGLGPYVTLAAPGGSLKISGSVVFATGWTIAAKGFSVPILVTMVPVPSYANPRLSLLVGFSFTTLGEE